jgi:diguanylate cyclase (GGDEF)-like protein/PAS domain S-box-containing protein
MLINNQDFYEILENLYDGLYITDLQRRILFWNKAAERITGFSSEEVIGKSCADDILCHVDEAGCNLCENNCPLSTTIKSGLPHESEIYLRHKQGHRVPVSVRVTPRFDDNGKVIGGIELFSDISCREVTELRLKELQQQAVVDHLTQMPNRVYLERELKVRMEEYRRTQAVFGVISIDIDHFKQVNDTYGHDIGDAVLIMVANTLLANARPFDLFGRWGGEEFIGLIRNISQANIEQFANRLRALVGASSHAKTAPGVSVTISIGITLVTPKDSISSLLKRADTLLYQSKANGRNCISCG